VSVSAAVLCINLIAKVTAAELLDFPQTPLVLLCQRIESESFGGERSHTISDGLL
jgi:hypothetical protein